VDVGCGTGEITRRLHELGLDIFGIDVSPGTVQVARAHHPDLTLAVAPLHALPLASRSVDGVVCWYVLQHVPDAELEAAFRELRRVIRPSAVAMVGFHSHSGTGSHAKTEGYGGHPMRVQVHRPGRSMWRGAGTAVPEPAHSL
jgi:ubiquinone/menaquinone biosynthesis C-methylase UbiE